MLPWSVGVFFILGLVIFLYLIRSVFSAPSPGKVKRDNKNVSPPEKHDIILAELTEKGKDEDYGILWNAPPGTYNFMIKIGTAEIASGTTSSETNIFKVRGLPLEIGKTYSVEVGDTKVEIPFFPPSFELHSLNTSSEYIDCNTSSTPTNIEVIINGNQKIPLSSLQIKIEPPGFIVNHPVGGNVVIMIYNGPNTANILTLSDLEGSNSIEGQTPIPF